MHKYAYMFPKLYMYAMQIHVHTHTQIYVYHPRRIKLGIKCFSMRSPTMYDSKATETSQESVTKIIPIRRRRRTEQLF